MKKIVKSAVVFASLAFVGVSANMIPEKASASSINTVQKVDDQSVYIPEAVETGQLRKIMMALKMRLVAY